MNPAQLTVSPVVRLTFWYTLIIVAISVMFSAIIYSLTASNVRASWPSRLHFEQQYGGRFAPLENDQIVAFFEERYEEVIARLRLSLLILNAAVLGAASVASYLLAKWTLHPIEDALVKQRQFTADASHELRTPLAAMKAEIEVALKHSDSTEHARTLRSTLEEVGRLEQLSASLLKLARHENAPEQPIFQPVSLDVLATEALRRVSPIAKQRQVVLEQRGFSGTIVGDEASLTDLVVILLENAVKYSPGGTVVTLRAVLAKGHATLTVEDHGAGIPAANLPHVFERFYRADAARTKSPSGGFGLGLAIAKQIVDLHRGTIGIASAVGDGTTVTVTLPRNG